jgi:hypothetical protein
MEVEVERKKRLKTALSETLAEKVFAIARERGL